MSEGFVAPLHPTERDIFIRDDEDNLILSP